MIWKWKVIPFSAEFFSHRISLGSALDHNKNCLRDEKYFCRKHHQKGVTPSECKKQELWMGREECLSTLVDDAKLMLEKLFLYCARVEVDGFQVRLSFASSEWDFQVLRSEVNNNLCSRPREITQHQQQMWMCNLTPFIFHCSWEFSTSWIDVITPPAGLKNLSFFSFLSMKARSQMCVRKIWKMKCLSWANERRTGTVKVGLSCT